MARRKSDAEVGPLGVWAYNTRDALDLSVEAVIAALPTTYSTATLRKVEGGSSRPGVRMWRELANLYTALAEEKGIALDPQPRLAPEPVEATQTPDGVAAAIDRLTSQMARIEGRLEALVGAEEGRADVLQLLLIELVGRVGGNAGEPGRQRAATR